MIRSRMSWGLVLAVLLAAPAAAFDAKECEAFQKKFRSKPIPEKAYPKPEDFQGPWPEGTFPLETGYEEGCRIGMRASVTVLCRDKALPLIPAAPVIAGDPEGFTVVMISAEDHAKLEKWKKTWMFYSSCKPKKGRPAS